MLNTVYIEGKPLRLNAVQAIGKGGEADIFELDATTALKIFKQPDHPDLDGDWQAQQAAKERLLLHQQKLPRFPTGLPARVITPLKLAYDRSKGIVGYSMRYLRGAEVLMRYTERSFRQAIPSSHITPIFLDLYPTVTALHQAQIVIGDFNDLNVLILNNEAYLIDADSFQYGPYPCTVYTARFVDPLLCNPHATSLELMKPHNPNSDWYAFTVMLFQTLLFTDPYGGVYRPTRPEDRIPHGQRPLRRITVFNPEVRYPKPALPYGFLPDDLLHFFQQTFEKDTRGVFPKNLLENLRWTKCTNCGTEHARAVCPECSHPAPQAVRMVTRVRGTVTATRIFRTNGLILHAAVQNQTLRYLYHENGKLMREGDREVTSLTLTPQLRFRIQGENTLVGTNSLLLVLKPGEQPERRSVDAYGTLPIFDANQDSVFWLQNGDLYRDSFAGPIVVGSVLNNQTLFWVGPNFGFGFYRAGALNTAFVFDTASRGLNDSVKLPPIKGQLIDSTCFFGQEYVWFVVCARDGGKTVNTCTVIHRNGSVLATAQAEEGDGSWLCAIRGKCAVGKYLFAATDDGIVRLEVQNGQVVKTAEFPDTEPFVTTNTHLFPAPGGMYAVSAKEVVLLRIS